jgi:hypothetical protein
MKTNDTTFNESDALKLIEQTITNTKQRLSDDGFSLIMWGWIVIIGNIINYIALEQEQDLLFLYWPVACSAGGIISGIVGSKRRSTATKSFTTNAMTFIWAGALISGTVLWFAAWNFGWHYINSAMFLAFAFPVFVSGGLMKFKPAIFGGLVLFAFAIGTFLIADESYSNLVSAAGFALGYLVPGYMLKSAYKSSNV